MRTLSMEKKGEVFVVLVAIQVSPAAKNAPETSPPFVFFPCLVFDDNFVVVFCEKALTRVFSSLVLTFVYVPAKKIIEIEPKSCSIHLVHHHPFFRRRPA